jgi:hypothetical protein
VSFWPNGDVRAGYVTASVFNKYKFSLIKELVLYIGLGLVLSKVLTASRRLYNIFNNIINLANGAFLTHKVKFSFVAYTN